ncbi:hypothetical protein BGI41_03030 [Methanobrevibacter sp. 87.7]|uniref:carboxymuconolactone decarboxylase family protein n=1 Tax=Methanobrevibacter sp. 87.7 TaxID=387957 RepID=UPI000B755002|nr:carboxymuconolactone decarboxylase family protein [Methanobrevibacter sp. 87.7]OWT33307.1 hypothetical protein BGI41_03030 [Methanobrevibacter sp. 87.7]
MSDLNINNMELISNYNPDLKYSDPELVEILDNFLLHDVFENCNLSTRSRLLVTLATLISNQSLNQYSEILIKSGITPIEIKEILYQSIPYIGLAKVYDFLNKTNDIFKDLNINLPLPKQSTTNRKNRVKVGYDIQANNFGRDFIDSSIENAPEGQKHIWDFISGFAFGDFYARNGLSDKDRELISFTFILSLRGCENQLRIHVKGNLKVGNDKETLISTISALVPYIGFPRVHNALAIVNEVCDNK